MPIFHISEVNRKKQIFKAQFHKSVHARMIDKAFFVYSNDRKGDIPINALIEEISNEIIRVFEYQVIMIRSNFDIQKLANYAVNKIFRIYSNTRSEFNPKFGELIQFLIQDEGLISKTRSILSFNYHKDRIDTVFGTNWDINKIFTKPGLRVETGKGQYKYYDKHETKFAKYGYRSRIFSWDTNLYRDLDENDLYQYKNLVYSLAPKSVVEECANEQYYPFTRIVTQDELDRYLKDLTLYRSHDSEEKKFVKFFAQYNEFGSEEITPVFRDIVFPEDIEDLTECDFSNTDMTRVVLQHKNLRNSIFLNSCMMLSQIDSCIMVDGNLRGADLKWSRMSHVDLGGALLIGTKLNHAIIGEGCDLRDNFSLFYAVRDNLIIDTDKIANLIMLDTGAEVLARNRFNELSVYLERKKKEKELQERPGNFYNVPSVMVDFYSSSVIVQMYENLICNLNKDIIQIIYGLCQSKKTKAVIDFIEKHKSAYELRVRWIKAHNKEEFDASYKDFANSLELNVEFDRTDIKQIKEKISNFVPQSLLIFDSVDDFYLLAEYMPDLETMNHHVIVIATHITEPLIGHPYKATEITTQNEETNTALYEESIINAVSILEESNFRAIEILKLCSFLDTEEIPMVLFSKVYSGTTFTKEVIRMEIEALRSYSLINNYANGLFSIPKVVQLVVIEEIIKDKESILGRSIQSVREHMADCTEIWDEVEILEKNRPLLQHALSLIKYIDNYDIRSLTNSDSSLSIDIPDLYADCGNLYKTMGLSIAEDYYRKALDLRVIVTDGYSTDPNIAKYKLFIGSGLQELEKYEDAMEEYNGALKIYKKIHETQDVGLQNIARTQYRRAHVLFEHGEYGDAKKDYEHVQGIYKEVYKDDKKKFLPLVAKVYRRLGEIDYVQNKEEEAIKHYNNALSLYQDDECYGAKEHPSVAAIKHDMGDVYFAFCQFQLALESYNIALRIKKLVYLTDEVNSHIEIAQTLFAIGNVRCWFKEGEYNGYDSYQEALIEYEEALKVANEVDRENHLRFIAEILQAKGNIYSKLFYTQRAKQNYEDALCCYEELLKRTQETAAIIDLKAKNIKKVQLLLAIGQTHLLLNNDGNLLNPIVFEMALKNLEDALSIVNELRLPDSLKIETLIRLGDTHFKQGAAKEALYNYEQALNILEEANIDNHFLKAEIIFCIGKIYSKLENNYQKAFLIYNEALGIIDNNILLTAEMQLEIGNVRVFLGEHKDAERHHLEALEITKKLLGKGHPNAAKIFKARADNAISLGRNDKALEFYKISLKINKRHFYNVPLLFAEDLRNIASIYISMSNLHDARENTMALFKVLEEVDTNIPLYERLYLDARRFLEEITRKSGDDESTLLEEYDGDDNSLSCSIETTDEVFFEATNPETLTVDLITLLENKYGSVDDLIKSADKLFSVEKYEESVTGYKLSLLMHDTSLRISNNHFDEVSYKILMKLAQTYEIIAEKQESMLYIEEAILCYRKILMQQDFITKIPEKDLDYILDQASKLYFKLNKPKEAALLLSVRKVLPNDLNDISHTKIYDVSVGKLSFNAYNSPQKASLSRSYLSSSQSSPELNTMRYSIGPDFRTKVSAEAERYQNKKIEADPNEIKHPDPPPPPPPPPHSQYYILNGYVAFTAITIKETIETLPSIQYFAKNILHLSYEFHNLINNRNKFFIHFVTCYVGVHAVQSLRLINQNSILSNLIESYSLTAQYALSTIIRENLARQSQTKYQSYTDKTIDSIPDFFRKCGVDMVAQMGWSISSRQSMFRYPLTKYNFLVSGIISGTQCYSQYNSHNYQGGSNTFIEMVLPYITDLIALIGTISTMRFDFSSMLGSMIAVKQVALVLNVVTMTDYITKLAIFTYHTTPKYCKCKKEESNIGDYLQTISEYINSYFSNLSHDLFGGEYLYRPITCQKECNFEIISRNNIVITKEVYIKVSGKANVILKGGIDDPSGKAKVIIEGSYPQVLLDEGRFIIHYNPQYVGTKHKYTNQYFYAKHSNKMFQTEGYMLVNNVYDFQNMNVLLSGKYALSNDITNTDVNKNDTKLSFIPLSLPEEGIPFTGVFDGNSFMISDVFIDCRKNYYSNKLFNGCGLFKTVADAEIRDLNIHNCSIVGDHYVGSLFGVAENLRVHNVNISNCSVLGNYVIGGLGGEAESSQFIDVICENNFLGAKDIYGSVLGSGYNIATDNCRCVIVGANSLIGQELAND